MKLNGRVALVTGGSRGIGRAVAEGLALEGAAVAVNYHANGQAAEEVVKAIVEDGGRAFSIQADTRDKSAVTAMIDQVVTEYGKIDILVNNAGVMANTPFLDLSEEEWDWVIQTNLKGYFLVGQAAARQMAPHGYGRIINMSSTRQIQSWPGNAHYCASKGGIHMLTRVMALELGPKGIRVNAVSPGTIETDLNRNTLANEEFRSTRIGRIPVGRLGRPEDVVGATVLLASEESDFVTGAFLMIDGGQTIW